MIETDHQIDQNVWNYSDLYNFYTDLYNFKKRIWTLLLVFLTFKLDNTPCEMQMGSVFNEVCANIRYSYVFLSY